MPLRVLAEEIKGRGAVTAQDVLDMRQALYADCHVDLKSAEVLFSINDACESQAPQWIDFFIEALTDHVVHQAFPRGYVTAANAEWLIDHISRDGRVETRTELELLLSVMDMAVWSPYRLIVFTLGEVREAVVSGSGVTRDCLALRPGAIGKAEIDIVRRALYAFGGDGSVGISRAEAEVLFEINAAIDDDAMPVEWIDLFVKAIANHVMAARGYRVPTRDEALRQESWLQTRDGVTGFLQKMVSGGVQALLDVYRRDDAAAAAGRLNKRDHEIAAAERITATEAGWLVSRIGKDGRIDPAETALLAFLKVESPVVDPALGPLLASVS